MVLSLQCGPGLSDRFRVQSSAAAAGLPQRRRTGLPEVLPFTMMPHPQTIVLAAFTAMMLAAAFEDFRRLVIPNALTLSMGALWVLDFAAEPSLYGGLAAIGCAAAVFLGGAVLFARGYLGGGDVKLLAAATLWAGPTGTPTLLVLTGM